MKVAIYVEGITEAGFVYQLIGEKYQWDWTKVQIECLNLDPQDVAMTLPARFESFNHNLL